jgi:hypothetical protein
MYSYFPIAPSIICIRKTRDILYNWLENIMVETTWNKNIKISLRELSCENVQWTEMVQEEWWNSECCKNVLVHLNSCSMAGVRLCHGSYSYALTYLVTSSHSLLLENCFTCCQPEKLICHTWTVNPSNSDSFNIEAKTKKQL